MAEEFEGPVIVKRPAGQPPNFEVAKFDGDVGLDGTDGTVKTTHVSAKGNVSARGNVNGATVNANLVNADLVALNSEVPPATGPGGASTSTAIQTVLKCHADDVLGVMHLRAEGNISALNNVNAHNVNVTGDVIVSNTDISIRQMAQTLAILDTRTAEMDQKLDDIISRLKTLSSMTSRMPDGRSLVNVVGSIWDKVKTL
jgi:hypothetical protein